KNFCIRCPESKNNQANKAENFCKGKCGLDDFPIFNPPGVDKCEQYNGCYSQQLRSINLQKAEIEQHIVFTEERKNIGREFGKCHPYRSNGSGLYDAEETPSVKEAD